MVLIFNSLSSSKQTKQQHVYYLWQAHIQKETQNHAFVTFLPNLALNRARYNSTAPHPHPSLMGRELGDSGRNWTEKKPNQTRDTGIMKPFVSMQSL